MSASTDQVSAWLNQAAIHLQQGKASAANRLLKQVLSQQAHPGLARGLELWRGGQSRRAARTLAEYSETQPEDFRALQARAHIAIQAGAIDEAIELLQQCLALHPEIMAVRSELSNLLMRRQRYVEALEQIDQLLQAEPESQQYLLFKAALMDRSGQYQPAIDLLRQVIRQQTEADQQAHQPPTELAASLTALAMIQRTVGDQDASIQSLQQAISHDPNSGWPWFQLADFKVYEFQPQQTEQIKRGLEQSRPGSMNEVHFAFALGRALESQQDFAGAFAAYLRGNQVRAALAPFDMQAHLRELTAVRSLFHPEVSIPLTQGAQLDCPVIFVVGLPRSGTTLADQIITAHSTVDGTMELPLVQTLVRELQQRQITAGHIPYPAAGTQLDPAEMRVLGQQYLQRASIQRGDAPFFVDKMPFNFLHIGLIRNILPGARIVNVHRHPMALGFSIFRQLFRFGQDWAFDLDQIAQYYLAYESLMQFWDEQAPGQIIHLKYEELVQSPEQTIQRLLHQLQLPEEDACFRPHENKRPVRTASSEQVRQPLYTDAIEYWRCFEDQLQPLRAALGNTAAP